MTTPAERLRARVTKLTDWLLLVAYLDAAKKFAAHPRCDGPDGDAHYELLKVYDVELLNRPHIGCCPDCAVPIRLNYHIEVLHGRAVAALADGILTSGIAAVQAAQTQAVTA